jgi:hypothetical protein
VRRRGVEPRPSRLEAGRAVQLRQRRLKCPARVLTPVPPIKSRLHHRNACGAGNRIRLQAACLLTRRSPLLSAGRALNPEPPAYKAVALTCWSYRPVAHPGIEPGDTALSERPLQPAGPCAERGRRRCRAPRFYPSRGFRPPLRRQPRIFHCGERRARSPARERRSAFEAAPESPAHPVSSGGRSLTGSSSIRGRRATRKPAPKRRIR